MKRKNPFENLTHEENKDNTPKVPNDNTGVKYSRPVPTAGISQSSDIIQSHYESSSVNNSDYEIAKKEFEVMKQFNCSKSVIRTTTECLPANKALLKEVSFPIGLIINPSAICENEVPVVNYGENEIPRCASQKCRGYINPFVKWINTGEKWICNLCGFINTTQSYYSSALDKSGLRLDMNKKPDLTRGSYEFIAGAWYSRSDKVPAFPLFIFLLDVSQAAVSNGYLASVIESLKDTIQNDLFPYHEKTKIAFITYDTNIHFYSINDKQSQPQILCVCDDEVFLPTIKSNLLVNIHSSKKMLLAVLDLIQNSFNASSSCRDSNKLFTAVGAAYLLGKDLGGKVIVFNASSSMASHPLMKSGNSINVPKDELVYTYTDEKKLSNLGISLTNENMSCDIFATSESFINLITLNQLCDYSNGNLYFYKNFKIQVHYKNIFNQIRRVLTRPLCWEAVMRTRFTNGYAVGYYLTPVLVSNGDLIILPALTSDQTYAFSIDISEVNTEKGFAPATEPFAYIQTAILYTHSDTTRRIRVHNLCLPLAHRAKDIYDAIDVDALSVFYMKQTVDKIYKTKKISNAVAYTESQFSTFISTYLSTQQSLKKELPDNLLYLPMYVLGMIKHRVLCKEEVEKRLDIDLSNYLRIKLTKMCVYDAMVYIYPRIYPLQEILYDEKIGSADENGNVVSTHSASLENDGLYLIDNGHLLIIYTRLEVDPRLLFSLFRVKDLQVLPIAVSEEIVFGEMDSLKEKIMNIIDYIRSAKSLFQNVIFVFEGTEGERLVKESLIEDNFCAWYPVDYKTFYQNLIGGMKPTIR